jgi:hypothetical protein
MTHIGHRVFICKEASTYLNPHVPRVPFFITFVSTPTFISSHKTTTVGAHRGAHEIKLRDSNSISIYNQVSSWLKVVSEIS